MVSGLGWFWLSWKTLLVTLYHKWPSGPQVEANNQQINPPIILGISCHCRAAPGGRGGLECKPFHWSSAVHLYGFHKGTGKAGFISSLLFVHLDVWGVLCTCSCLLSRHCSFCSSKPSGELPQLVAGLGCSGSCLMHRCSTDLLGGQSLKNHLWALMVIGCDRFPWWLYSCEDLCWYFRNGGN